MADSTDIQALITELHTHYRNVQEKVEFLALKQSELRPGDEISFFGFHQAREELRQEHSLLAGHALMVQETIAREQITVTAPDQRLLNEIAAFSRQQFSPY
jgi:predicted deacetylase